jgi:hypothetical protein
MRVAQSPEARDARRWETAVAQLIEGVSGGFTGNPNNGNASTTWSGGKSVNGHGGSFLAAKAA